ncbi:MAG: amino acid ABC transporter permease [Cutibacterium avidum]|nr:amino acid ABC transporter permease [Cutibacterium avidum]
MQPLLDPQTWILLLQGLWVSVRIALVSMVLSIMLAIPLGLVMDSRRLWVRILTRGYVEALRLLPQLVLLFVVYFEMAQVAGLDVSGEAAAIIVFTLWGTAEMGDLVRGAIAAVPHHKIVSAQALGMSDRAVRRHIVMPLALRQLVPLTVNLVTRMIKTTALVSLIGVVEILKVAQAIIDRNRFDHPDAALWIYGTVFCLYFIVCFVISLYSRHLERRMTLS